MKIATDENENINSYANKAEGLMHGFKEKQEGNVYILDFWWWTPVGLLKRLKESRIYDILVKEPEDADITIDEIDSIVGQVSTINTLIIGMPIGFMQALGPSSWDDLRDLVDSCSDEQRSQLGYASADEYIMSHYSTMSSVLITGIYIPIFSIIISIWYYITRPHESKNDKDDKTNDTKFRIWWLRGRYLFTSIVITTAFSVILVVFAMNMYYLNFFGISTDFCQYTSIRRNKLMSGWIVLVLSLGLFLYLFI